MTSVTRAAGALPAAFTSFVGRRQEMAEVRRLLGAARLVTLAGAGGVGKTRLALEAASASARAFPGGVWLVDLTPVREPDLVVEAAAVTLGVADQGTRPVADLLAAHLSDRRLLMVLDNCEHLVDACAQLAQRLLSAAPEVRILATSRETLRLTGEHVVNVAPLPPDDAAELLAQRAAAVRPGFTVTDDNRQAVQRLCADLDGLPLAIELAASRLRTLGVEPVVERLADRFALLTAGSRAARPHQRTLRAAVDWSWELCGPAERVLWSRLTVFAGSFTLAAAEDVCAGEGLAAAEVMDVLDRLVTQSLVELAGTERRPRYRLLETIRQYGAEHLTADGDDGRVRSRHRDHFLALAERCHRDWSGPAQAETLARLHADHGNLMAALEYQRTDPGADGQAALALPAALAYHWLAGGCLSEGRRYLERALTAAPEPTAARARALLVATHVAYTQHDLTAARRHLDEAGELAAALGDQTVLAAVGGHRAALALREGRTAEAVTRFAQAVADHIALGDRHGEIGWRCGLGIAQTLDGHPDAAETSARALADAEEHGERWARARLLMVLGRHAWDRGEPAEARLRTVAALDMLRGFSDGIGVADMLEQLALITASEGDPERAARLLGTARGLRKDAGVTTTADDRPIRAALTPAAYDRALAAGAAVHGPDAAVAHALDDPGTPHTPALPHGDGAGLTHREEQIAALVATGMTNRRIAAELVLSPRTVDNHVTRILTKLRFTSRAQIAAWWAAK
ncbi:LuxR C-terminal-related transcriptional regulator [Streptomyces sp. NPDC004539]|uniref:ATP-binding protein n=1 Tax=Streptomyces sp. NPDC004539 TaxID=3154280 RepID=UPI0033AE5ACE